MTRIELDKRRFINIGINMYKEMLKNPSVKIHRADGIWYGVSKNDLSLIRGKEGDIGQPTGNFFRLGKSTPAIEEYTLGQLELGVLYRDVEALVGDDFVYALNENRELLSGVVAMTKCHYEYNEAIKMRFVEVTDD